MLKQTLNLFWSGAFGKLIGIAREVLFASFFGTTAAADAFRAVFTTTISFSHLFTSEAISTAFIPQFRIDSEKKDNSEWSLFNGVGLLLFIISICIGFLLYFFANTWISIFFPGFKDAHLMLSVEMLKIMALGVPLYVLSALLISLEVGSGQFHLATLRPLVQNTGIIMAIIIAFKGGQPDWIAWGFTGTYLIFILLAAIWISKRGILKPGWYRHWEHIQSVAKRFWNTMKPMAVFSILAHANVVLEKTIASLIGSGAVATIDYARIIPDTIQFLIVVPLGLVSLSAMTNLSSAEVSNRSDKITTMGLLLFVPLSGFVLLSAPDIVRLFYGRGAFDEASVIRTAQALRGMSVGIWAVCIANILINIYNARLRNYEVLRIGIWGISANALFNVFTYQYLGVMAIGLGFSLGGIVMAWFLIKDVEGMISTLKTAKICLLGSIPYIVIGLMINSLNYPQTLNLLIQMVWILLFWGGIYFVFPISRNMLKLFFRTALRVW